MGRPEELRFLMKKGYGAYSTGASSYKNSSKKAASNDRVVCPNPAKSSALVKIPLKPDKNLPDLRRTAQVTERVARASAAP